MVEILHRGVANMAMLYFLALALWGFWRFMRKQGPGSSYWGALAIAEILVVVQAVLGGYLWFAGARPPRGSVHVMYGLLIPAVIPLIYAFTRGGDKRRASLVYGASLLFAVGLILRAITTGLDPLP